MALNSDSARCHSTELSLRQHVPQLLLWKLLLPLPGQLLARPGLLLRLLPPQHPAPQQGPLLLQLLPVGPLSSQRLPGHLLGAQQLPAILLQPEPLPDPSPWGSALGLQMFLLTELWVSWPQTPGLWSLWDSCPELWIWILPLDLWDLWDLWDVQELPVLMSPNDLQVLCLLDELVELPDLLNTTSHLCLELFPGGGGTWPLSPPALPLAGVKLADRRVFQTVTSMSDQNTESHVCNFRTIVAD